uniref:Uncharacterized protein n=1 Tax=Tanacetum cinerariifolium TaxID=118510 RepID=A0A699QK83_TANCI|nr:hypothetical protein [Tanacetum cinerariifolium]
MSNASHSIKQGWRAAATTVLVLFCLQAQAEPLQVVTEDSSYSELRDGKVVGVASEIVEQTLAKAGDAKNYSIGVVRDDSRQEYLEGKGFSKMVVSSNNLDNLRKLLSGQVALVPLPEREAREQCADLHIAFEDLESVYTIDELSKGLYVALSLKTPDETVKRITAAFAQLKEDGTLAKVMAQ